MKIDDNIGVNFKENIIKISVVLVIVATTYLFLGNIFLAFMIGFASGVLLLDWDTRVFIGIALIFLISCPFLLIFERSDVAEEMAVNAYYMLALGVIFQIIQYFKESVFSETKTEKPKTIKSIESWSKKKTFLLTIGVVSLILCIFAGGFTFFYLKINNKLSENDQLIAKLIDSNLEASKKAAENIESEELKKSEDDLFLFNNSDINVSILNGSTTVGVARGLETKMIEDGFDVANVDTADKDDYKDVLIRYSLDNLEKANIVKKYLTTIYENIEVIEDIEILTDVEIVLGNQ